jgi:hypothetical protein
MDGCVDDQDYDDGTENHHPIGKLNARYLYLFAKPFHDCSSHTRIAAYQERNATEVRLYMSKFLYRRQRDDEETQERGLL